MSKCIHFIAHGRVQGVSYRAFTRQVAQRHGLSGWVRNCGNGTVEGACEGPDAKVDAFLGELGHGPLFAKVTRLEVRASEPLDMTVFEVRR